MLQAIIKSMRRELAKTPKPRQSPLWLFDPWVMLQQTIIDLDKIAQGLPAEFDFEAENGGAERRSLLASPSITQIKKEPGMGSCTIIMGSGMGIGGNGADMGSGSGVGGGHSCGQVSGGGPSACGQTSGGGPSSAVSPSGSGGIIG